MLDATQPADNVRVSDLPAYIRETRAAVVREGIANTKFETGVAQGDAVFLDSAYNIWRKSRAGDPTRDHFHGIANVDTESVAIFGFYQNTVWAFTDGQTVYVSAAVAGGFTLTNTGLVAGTAIGVDTLLLDSQIAKSFELLRDSIIAATGVYDSLDERLDQNDQVVANVGAEVSAARSTYPSLDDRIQATEDEITAARGTVISLGTRLSVAMNPDGSLKANVTNSPWVQLDGPLTRLSDTVFEAPGDVSFLIASGPGRALQCAGVSGLYVADVVYNDITDVSTVEVMRGTLPTPLANCYYAAAKDTVALLNHADLEAILAVVDADTNADRVRHVSSAQATTWNNAVEDLSDLTTAVDKSIKVAAGYFPVTAFGAIGNGIIDDTEAVQAAIDACHAFGGGAVFFPTGDYMITAKLSFPAPVANQQIILAGNDVSSRLLVDGQTFSGNAVIEIKGATGVTTMQGRHAIRDLYIICSETDYLDNPTHPAGIWIEEAYAIELRNVVIAGFNNYGLLLRGVWDPVISRVYVWGCGSYDGVSTKKAAVLFDRTVGTNNNTVYVDALDVESYRGRGCHIQNATWVAFYNCKFHGNAASTAWAALAFENLYCEGAQGFFANTQVRGNDVTIGDLAWITFAGTYNNIQMVNTALWATLAERHIRVMGTVVDGAITLINTHALGAGPATGYIKIDYGAGWLVSIKDFHVEPENAAAVILQDDRLGATPIDLPMAY